MTKCSKLTHAHVSGVNGALLQAMAVKLALRAEGDVEPFSFLDRLLQQIQPFEENTDLSEAKYVYLLWKYVKNHLYSRKRHFLKCGSVRFNLAGLGVIRSNFSV